MELVGKERESLARQLKQSREDAKNASGERHALMKRAVGAESLVNQLKEEHAIAKKGVASHMVYLTSSSTQS